MCATYIHIKNLLADHVTFTIKLKFNIKISAC